MLTCLIIIGGLLRLLAAQLQNSYVLLPRTSGYCKEYVEKYPGLLTVSVVMQITMDTTMENVNLTDTVYYRENNYICMPEFYPWGEARSWNLDANNVMKFWYLRFKIIGYFTDCKSQLVVTENPRKESPIKHVFDCKSKFPTVLESTYRYVEFYWDAIPGSSSNNSASVNISRYVRFSDNVTTEVRQARCGNAQSLFFYCNLTSVCIPSTSACDDYDDCFDGGSDEIDCPKMTNDSNHRIGPDHSHGSWISTLPWIALGILPFILIFALAKICTQKRHLDIGEDYKMGFNTEDEEEGEDGAVGATGPRSERSCSPDVESTRSGGQGDYDEGYSLPRHKKTMSASSDYLPANFAELTASPANRARRAENERGGGHPIGVATPTKPDPPPVPQMQQQHKVAVQINNPVYGNNVYVDVPTAAALKDDNYTRPNKQVVVVAPVPKSERMRNGQEEYTPLLPPLPPEAELPSPEKSAPIPVSKEVPVQRLSSSGTNDDYEEDLQPSSYDDDLMTPPPPSGQGVRGLGGDGERPEMLHLRPLLRAGANTSSVSSPKTPSAPEHISRDSDYDKNYIVV